MYIIWNSYAIKICTFSHLLIQLFIYIIMDFFLWIIIQYFHYLLYCSNAPALTTGSSFRMVSISLLYLTISLSTSKITFWHCKLHETIWYFPFPSPRINHFSKETWFFLLENRVRNQDLGARYVIAVSLLMLLDPLSGHS